MYPCMYVCMCTYVCMYMCMHVCVGVKINCLTQPRLYRQSANGHSGRIPGLSSQKAVRTVASTGSVIALPAKSCSSAELYSAKDGQSVSPAVMATPGLRKTRCL